MHPADTTERTVTTICCISDTHGDHAALQLPEADVLLHGGDFTNFGRDGDVQAFDLWGAAQPQQRECRILVLGNHENRWVQDDELAELRAMLPSWTLLHDDTHQVAGLTFYGTRFLSEHESECQTVRLPAGIDVLVTHNPPHGSLDGGGSGHVALRKAAEQSRPKLHVFGHIHGGAGTERVGWRGNGGTLLVNAANCLVRKIGHPPIVVVVSPGAGGRADELPQGFVGAGGEACCPVALAQEPVEPEPEPEPEPQPQPQPQPQPEPQHAAVDTDRAPPMCGRFRHLKLCGCTIPCRVAMAQVIIDQIRPFLFIGPVQAAYNWDQLTTRGITRVVDLCGSTYDRNPALEYLCIEVDDDPGADIIPAVRESLPFINECIDRGDGVLVHCKAGKSRSATVCAAWLMAREGLGAEAAIAAVKARHARTDPNQGFREALAACDGSYTGWLK
jgi:Icc-related predicted phosphoesterase